MLEMNEMSTLILSQMMKYARKTKKLTIQELSDISSYTDRYISEIESGRKSINKDTMKAILKSINIGFNEKLNLEEEFNGIVEMYVDRDFSYIERLKKFPITRQIITQIVFTLLCCATIFMMFVLKKSWILWEK